jgi:tetratricopeptide (TPR) repeat protein
VRGEALDEEQRGDLKRLARRLEEYYEAEGAGDPVRASVSPGDGSVRWEVRDAGADLGAWIPPVVVEAGGNKTKTLIYVLAGLLAAGVGLGVWLSKRPAEVAPEEVKGLAVLPFEDTRPMGEQDGITDSMTAVLAREMSYLEGVRVPEHSSSSQYKYRLREPANIKTTLGADVYVEGRMKPGAVDVEGELWMRRSGDGAVVWRAGFRSPRAQLLEALDRAAEEIAKVAGKTLPERALVGRKAGNANSERAYLAGIGNIKEDPRAMEAALRAMEQAEKEAPEFAAALGALAEMWARITALEYRPVAEAAGKAREYARKAQAAEADSAEAHLALGVAAYAEWNWAEARKELEEAVRLRPNYAYAWNRLGHVEQTLGRTGEALKRMKEAYGLDPYRPSVNLDLGFAYVFDGQYDAALEQMNLFEKQDPYHNVIRMVRSLAYLEKGNWSAVDSFQRPLMGEEGFEVPATALMGVNEARAGRMTEAAEMLKKLRAIDEKSFKVDRALLAGVLLAMGRKDEGYRALEEAVAKRSTVLLTLAVNPVFKQERGEARFQAVLRKMGVAK